VQAIVLSPTRELALQITNELKKLGMYTGTKIVTIYGGQSINIQFKALKHGAHAIVGTPGRTIDHIKRGTLKLDLVKNVVIDEADTMLDMGFIDDVEFILDSISDARQLSLFSATMPQRIIELSEKYMRNPEKILIDSDEPSVDTLEQYYLIVEQDNKLSFLIDILRSEKPSSSMIFCRTRHGVYKLTREMKRRFLNVVPLHGDLSQSQREHSMHLFRSGRADILVATDVASRGIDIPQVDCVINHDVPHDPLLYFHRVGRTARAGDSGKAFTLISKQESYDFARICSLTKASIKPLRPEDEQMASNILRNRYDKRPRDEKRRSKGTFRSSRFRRKRRYR
jgi:ATP-dependent RNA helicase DeaD